MSLPDFSGVRWHPSLPFPLIVTLAGLAALSAIVFIIANRNLRGWAKPFVLLIRRLRPDTVGKNHAG